MKKERSFVPFRHPIQLTAEDAIQASQAVLEKYDGRRTVRDFTNKAVPREIIENCLRAASTAPSGAHKQPWHFAVVQDLEKKQAIRKAAEAEEKEFYSGRAPEEWLEALHPIGTNHEKPFLEEAPFLIGIFAKNYDILEDGTRSKNYYVSESVGIAAGMLIAALHECGLSTLTHTPSPMGFLNEIMERPSNERAIILLVVGYAADDATVPDLQRKDLNEYASFL